jgi:hypothetical protein
VTFDIKHERLTVKPWVIGFEVTNTIGSMYRTRLYPESQPRPIVDWDCFVRYQYEGRFFQWVVCRALLIQDAGRIKICQDLVVVYVV